MDLFLIEKKTIFVFDGLNLRRHLFDNFSTTCTCRSWFKMYSISNILYEAEASVM